MRCVACPSRACIKMLDLNPDPTSLPLERAVLGASIFAQALEMSPAGGPGGDVGRGFSGCT